MSDPVSISLADLIVLVREELVRAQARSEGNKAILRLAGVELEAAVELAVTTEGGGSLKAKFWGFLDGEAKIKAEREKRSTSTIKLRFDPVIADPTPPLSSRSRRKSETASAPTEEDVIQKIWKPASLENFVVKSGENWNFIIPPEGFARILKTAYQLGVSDEKEAGAVDTAKKYEIEKPIDILDLVAAIKKDGSHENNG